MRQIQALLFSFQPHTTAPTFALHKNCDTKLGPCTRTLHSLVFSQLGVRKQSVRRIHTLAAAEPCNGVLTYPSVCPACYPNSKTRQPFSIYIVARVYANTDVI